MFAALHLSTDFFVSGLNFLMSCIFCYLQKVKEQAKAAQSQVDARKMAFNTANSILHEGEESLPDLNLPRPPLFDVVYRIPEASLKLARDDRQAGRYYMKQREKIIKTGTMDDPKPRRYLTPSPQFTCSQAKYVCVRERAHVRVRERERVEIESDKARKQG